MSNSQSKHAVLVILFAAMFSGLHADEKQTEPDVQKQIVDYWLKASRDHAKTYSIYPAGKSDKPFPLYEQSVFQHIQVVRGNDIGAYHLWTYPDNRPAALCTVFAWTEGSSRIMFNELHSLADGPIESKQDEKALWTSKSAGTNWKPVPDAPKPHPSATRRRLQAKQLFKQFRSHMIDPKKKRWELRSVPTPVYEYQVKDSTTRSGALFVFCRGTDVETVLLLEVRPVKDSPSVLSWQFTCAKFTDYEPHITIDGTDQWDPPADAYLQNGNAHFWAPIGARPMPEFEIAGRNKQ